MPDRSDTMAFVFDGHGGARTVGIETLTDDRPTDGTFMFAWVHLTRGDTTADIYLHQLGLDQFVIDALVAEETRPRCTVHGEGALLNLRGVNLNPGAEPEDMISARFWLEKGRMVGVWLRPLAAVSDLLASFDRNQAPTSPGDLIAKLSLRLADRAEPVVASLNERVDALEEAVLEKVDSGLRRDLAEIRHTSIVLRRYMIPQRDALTSLEIEDVSWLRDRDRSRLREAADRVTRLGEELDAIRDRSQIVQDQLMDRRAEIMNRNMMLLSVVAAIFLPLGLLTGLLGINVGGIPGTDDPNAFVIVCGILVAVVAVQILLFRLFGILR